MKKIANLLCATVLAGAFAGLAACNEPETPFVDVPFLVHSWMEGTPGSAVPAIQIDFSRFVVTPSDAGKVVIVNSREELESYVWKFSPPGGGDIIFKDLEPAPDLSSIDFSKITVLLVGGYFDTFTGGGIVHPFIRSFRYFPSGKYELDVKLGVVRTPSSLWVKQPEWCVPVLIDKIGGDSKFEVKVSPLP